MIQHPDVVKKAQSQIDEIVGMEHLPTLGDRPNLPYVECIVKEVIRYFAEILDVFEEY